MATTEPTPDDPQTRLDAAILGRVPELTAEQVAAGADVSVEDARRLWRALGFPEVGDEAAFTLDDVGALVRLREAVQAGVDLDTLTRVTRAVGRTMARLADWEVANLLPTFEEQYGSLSDDERMDKAVEFVNAITPSFELLLLYTWRRQLAAAAIRSGALVAAHDEVHVTATIGFADLVSFTALSNELDDDQIGDLVEVFEARCHDVVSGHRGRIIKSIGDSVLFVADTPEDGIDIALDMIAVIGGDARLPDVKVGLATGPLVQRMGDVYGPAVNLAARLTSVARRNRVIIDSETASLLSPEDFETRLLPARPLRGFGEVEPLTVRRTRPRH